MVVVSHPSPCLCLDSIPKTNMSVKNGINGEVLFMERRASMKRKQLYVKPQRSMELTSGFVFSWYDSRLISKPISLNVGKCSRTHRKSKRLVDELGGQYEDGFEDVKTQLVNYFTYKAVRTVLNQLYEMNPPHYTWFYNFVVANKPADSKRFMRTLTKENQDLAERVMVTRLHLYGKWVKKCNHDEIYKEISDQNVELMRERLMETVIWPSDDTNTERIG